MLQIRALLFLYTFVSLASIIELEMHKQYFYVFTLVDVLASKGNAAYFSPLFKLLLLAGQETYKINYMYN